MFKMPPKKSAKGWTIVELMMVVGLLGLIVPALTMLFITCFQGLATVEMHLQLKALNEQMALHFHEQINSSKHMFQNNASSGGTVFINNLQMTGAPASMSFTKMAQTQTGSVTTFSPAAGAQSSEFGDCLFYADADRPLTISGNSYKAPLTITGITNTSGASVTVNLDIYRFYYDYLSSTGDMKPIPNMTSYWLIEWQSVQFVDAFELEDIGSADATLLQHVITWLTTGTNFPSGKPVTYAWDPSQIAMTSGSSYAFYQLAGTAMTGQTTFTIPMQSWYPLSRTSSGAISPFNYGIPGNYANVGGSPSIPLYCPATSSATTFPGGFEVGIEGANGGTQVLVRTLLAAHGNSKNNIWDNISTVNNCRDIW